MKLSEDILKNVQLKDANESFTIGNYSGSYTKMYWAMFPGWGLQSKGPYTPDDSMFCSGRGDQNGNIWLTIHSYNGLLRTDGGEWPIGQVYPGRCAGRYADFRWGTHGEWPDENTFPGCQHFFDSPIHLGKDDFPSSKDRVALYLDRSGKKEGLYYTDVRASSSIEKEWYLGKLDFKGGNIESSYYMDPQTGEVTITAYYWISCAGYFTDWGDHEHPSSPTPVKIGFTSQHFILPYYPMAVFDPNKGKYYSCDEDGRYLKIIKDGSYQDVLNYYGGPRDGDKGFIIANNSYRKIKRAYSPK